MTLPISIPDLLERFDGAGVHAIVLMGSYARGNPGPFSDIDIVRFTDEIPPPGSGEYLISDHLVVVSDANPSLVAAWFSRPELAVGIITNLRQAHLLLDRNAYFATIQRRAWSFTWDEEMQARANQWASQQLVGLIEEVQKGLTGVRSGDVGRLLNARFGLSWGLSRVMQVQRGVLLSGDNGFYDEVAHVMSKEPEWLNLRRRVFAIEGPDGHIPPLRDQVLAGLRLYLLTAELLTPILHPDDLPVITRTIDLIETTLDEF